MAFTAGASSQGAFGVRAENATCSQARRVASAARSCDGCDYQAQGFACHASQSPGGLARFTYACANGRRRVTFTRAG